MLGLVFAASAFSAPVEIGMSEAKLLETKGKPEWRGTSGKITTISWPDMQVSLLEGKVDHIQLRDLKKEKKITDEKKTAATDGPPEDLIVQVVEVLSDGGVIVELLKESSGLVKTDHSPSTGAGGNPAPAGGGGGGGYVATGTTVYVQGLTKCADGDRYKISAAPAGSHKYETKTFHRYISYRATKL